VRIVRGLDALPADMRLCVVVGIFDGVHRGHQQLLVTLDQASRRLGGMPTVVTFDPHPDAVVFGRAPDLLMDPGERLERLALAGVGLTVVQRFDETFRRTSAEDFVARIRAGRSLAAMVMTAESAFGRDRGGTLHSVRLMGADAGFEVVEARRVFVGGSRVSSARIRELVARGRVSHARALLGHPHALVGDVVHGEQRGRDLGFPTANLAFADPLCLPPDGIFAGRASWGGERLLSPRDQADAVISLGTQPTFGGRVRVLEVHLLDREVDVYGQRMRVEVCRRLRDQHRYDSVDELVAQMHRDVGHARAALRRLARG
jgi:riboflavin kinase/FMN adenylyltransferase